jgi:hypothetical protein
MTWHLDDEALARYAAGEARTSEAASAEAHLLRCAACRSAVAPRADAARLAAVFEDVVDVLDAPRAGRLERLLRATGVRPATARLLVATPALRASWLLAVAGALAFAVAAVTRGPESRYVFLALAPLLPVLGVALAYGPEADPAYDVAVAAPYGGFRLLLLRTAAVVATTTAGTLAATVFLPDARLAAAWLLPALALTTATLVAGTVWTPAGAAAFVGVCWLTVLAVAARIGADVTDARGQVTYAVLLAAGAALLAARRDRYEREAGA